MSLFYEILLLLSGLGISLYGINSISVSMRALASQQMRHSIHKFSSSPVKSFGTGLATTMLVQNSSVSTVLIVGLLNAELISLYHAFSMLLGCRIGASLILLLFCLGSFNVVEFFSLLVLVGALILMFCKSNKLQRIGKILAGFGLLFCGLKIMSMAMNDIMAIDGAREFVASINNVGILLLIGILFGATFHVFGTTALMISLIELPSSPFTILSALIVVIGANIGTTFTTILAGLNSNIHSKRASLFYTFINIVGVLIILLIVCATPWISWLESFIQTPSLIIVFSIIVMSLIICLIFTPLLKPMEKLFRNIVKDKSASKGAGEFFVITKEEMQNALVVKQKTVKALKTILLSLQKVYEKLQEQMCGTKSKNNTKIIDNEILIAKQRLNDIKDVLLQVSFDEDKEINMRIKAHNNTISDFEKIIQFAENLQTIIDTANSEQKTLVKSEIKIIDNVCDIINKLFINSLPIYDCEINDEKITLEQGDIIVELENDFSHQKTNAKKLLLKTMSSNSQRNYDILFDIFSKLDRACDHLINLIIKLI